MIPLAKINNKFDVVVLSKDMVIKNSTVIARLVDQIPLVTYTERDVLAESKDSRKFFGKWEHSLVVFDHEQPIAVIIGYERVAEDNTQYPENSLYISELAVDLHYQKQGIARRLVALFLQHNNKLSYLSGPLVYTVQTNSAVWNQHVQNLYKSFGFKEVGRKTYNNRTDLVLKLGTVKQF
jgi:ribosomal protein S18 acetylase RimI-like enzyme